MKMIKKAIKLLLSQKIKKIDDDLYIRRLRSLVIGEGMLHEGNIYLIDLAIQKMPECGNVVEIGSYGGLSTNLISYLLSKYDRKQNLFCCDPWVYEGYLDSTNEKSEMIDGRKNISRMEYSKYMKNAFINSVNFLSKGKPPFAFELTSEEFFKKYQRNLIETDLFGKKAQLGGPISFAYIDGNHSLEYVKKDFENVDKFLLKLGFVLFDDSKDNLNFGSAKFMNQMNRNSNYRLVERNPHYLFQKIK